MWARIDVADTLACDCVESLLDWVGVALLGIWAEAVSVTASTIASWITNFGSFAILSVASRDEKTVKQSISRDKIGKAIHTEDTLFITGNIGKSTCIERVTNTDSNCGVSLGTNVAGNIVVLPLAIYCVEPGIPLTLTSVSTVGTRASSRVRRDVGVTVSDRDDDLLDTFSSVIPEIPESLKHTSSSCSPAILVAHSVDSALDTGSRTRERVLGVDDGLTTIDGVAATIPANSCVRITARHITPHHVVPAIARATGGEYGCITSVAISIVRRARLLAVHGTSILKETDLDLIVTNTGAIVKFVKEIADKSSHVKVVLANIAAAD